jgi:GNAT superfamily N-acetyltransferase
MNIREIQYGELNKLLSLYVYLHENDDKLPNFETIKGVWEQIKSDRNIKYFGVFESNELLSSCTIILVPNLTRSCRSYGLIENVVTNVEYRKRGLGKAVLEKALEFAWENNCYKVMLMTGRLDEETFKFYESVGFNRQSKQAFIIKRK